jgi:hypothetical protein
MQSESIKLTKLGVLDQLAVAAQPQNRLALAAGSILGGLIPIASFIIAHYEAANTPEKWALVVAGMLYSGTSVFDWGTAAFHSRVKAIGFVVLTEGVSLFSTTMPLAIAAVSVLVAINAASTGCHLILDRKISRSAGARPSRARKNKAKKKMPAPKLTAVPRRAVLTELTSANSRA